MQEISQQNIQITKEQAFLFSLVHENTKYDFIGLSKIDRYQLGQNFRCQIYPLKENNQVIRIQSHSLKIELNQFLLESNLHISSSGFKFKIHPISGIFVLQYSYLSFAKGQSSNLKQKYQTQKNNLILKLKNSPRIKKFIAKILTINEEGSSIHDKQSNLKQILKFSFNSEFYAWISPNKQKFQEIKKTFQSEKDQKSNNQVQVWSDCSFEEDEENCQKQHQTNQSFYEKSEEEKEKSITFSDFYYHYRSKYDQINPFPQTKNENRIDLQSSVAYDTQMVVRFFMSERDDLKLYQNYLQKHVKAVQQENVRRKNISKVNEDMMYFGQNHKQNSSQSDQLEQQHNLINFLESNHLTLSKSSKWKVVIQIVSRIYQNFIDKKVKQKSHYLDMRTYKIIKNLQVSLKSKEDQFGFLILPQIKKLSEEEIQIVGEPEQTEDFFLKQKEQQQNIASLLLYIICFITVPEVKFLNRRMSKAFQILQDKYQTPKINHQKRQYTIEGDFMKFKASNTQLQSIFFYSHQKILQQNQAPFCDWVIIMCEKMKESFAKNPLYSY